MDPSSGPDVPETVESLRSELDLLETQYHSNLDAHALVLETKEEVLRSLLKQNASLTMDRSGLQRERETLLCRVEELSEAIRAMQKAQNLLAAAGGPAGAGGKGIRGGGGGKHGRGSGSGAPSPATTPKVTRSKKAATAVTN